MTRASYTSRPRFLSCLSPTLCVGEHIEAEFWHPLVSDAERLRQRGAVELVEAERREEGEYFSSTIFNFITGGAKCNSSHHPTAGGVDFHISSFVYSAAQSTFIPARP